MKKNLIYILLFLSLISCNNQEKRSKKLINQYMKEHLNDYKSYESVSFGTLDSAFSRVSDTKEWKDYDQKYLEFEKKADDASEKMKKMIDNIGFHSLYTYKEDKFTMELLKDKVSQWADSMKFYNDKMIILNKDFKKEFIGWKLTHTFRANNIIGNKIIEKYDFIFDEKINKIIDIRDDENTEE